MNNLTEFVKNKTFEEIREIVLSSENYCLRDNNNLYLIAKNNSNKEKQSENEKQTNELDDDKDFLYTANGMIFEKTSNEVVCACQNDFLKDLTQTEFRTNSEFHKLLNNVDEKDIRYEFLEDGTTIRLYNYKNRWFTATTRCMDSENSYWSSEKSFGEMFWDIFSPHLLSRLNKSKTYVFTLLHRDNRIVVKHNTNMLIYICCIDNFTLKENYSNIFYDIYCIKRPQKINNINDYTDLFKLNNNKKRGILVKIYNKMKNKFDCYKIDFDKYCLIKEVRGNVPEIRMRYLQLLGDKQKLFLLEKYYKEYQLMFEIIKSAVADLIAKMYKLYVDSHIKHSVTVDETDKFHKTLKQLHAQYKTTNKSIQYSDVRQKIYSLNCKALKELLGFY